MARVERRELTKEEALLKWEIQYVRPGIFENIKQSGRGVVVLFLPTEMQVIGTELRLAKNEVTHPGEDHGGIEMTKVIITKVLGNNQYEVSGIGTA